MVTIEQQLNQLTNDKKTLANNLVSQGVEATEDETFTSLVPKVLDIETGGGGTEVEKGLKILAYNENGRATDIEIVGFTSIPSYYLYEAGYNNGWLAKGSNLKMSNDVTVIGNNAFYSSNVTNIKVSNALKKIEIQAFRASNIASIELPATLIIIESNVFYGCTNLKQVISRATTPPTLDSNAFKNSPIGYSTPTGFIYVPDESIDAYKSATNWSTYASAIKGLSELEG